MRVRIVVTQQMSVLVVRIKPPIRHKLNTNPRIQKNQGGLTKFLFRRWKETSMFTQGKPKLLRNFVNFTPNPLYLHPP